MPSCLTLCNPMNSSTPGLPVPHHLPEFAQVHVHWIADAIQLPHPLLPPSLLPLVFPSIRVFYNDLALRIRWPEGWSFSFSISPSSEYSGLMSFRMDWSDLLVVQATLQESSPAPWFKSISSSALWSNSHIPTWLHETKKPTSKTGKGDRIKLKHCMLIVHKLEDVIKMKVSWDPCLIWEEDKNINYTIWERSSLV